MIKKGLLLFVVLALVFTFVVSASGNKDSGGTAASQGKVKIIFTSWRTEDIDRMNRINAVYMKKHPEVEIVFQPINDNEYDAQMKAALETGTGADVIFLRSYDTGLSVFKGGSLAVLNDEVPAVKDFPSAAQKAWSTEDGQIYGVPFAGVTHGVYYHKAVFDKYGLKEPETWDEFIQLAQTLKDKGEVVFAQGALDDWTCYEVVFSGVCTNWWGGEKARQALMAGEQKLTDANWLSAFKAEDQLQQFFPKGYEALDYVSMQQMFGTGQAAMFMGGSWELGVFEDLGSGSEDIGWFPPPLVHKGDKMQYCFHVDAGIGLNKNSKHYKEALDYVRWTATPEFAELFMNELPGFFAYTPGNYNLSNPLAKEMIGVAANADLTVRAVWEKMSAQSPSGNSLMGEALTKMWKDEFTPEQAAAYVQNGLATWYKPFQK